MKLEIYNMARQRGANCISFGTSTGQYFSTSSSGHGAFCGVDEKTRRNNGVLRSGCVPECQVNVPFWLRFLADVGWHQQANK